MTKTPKKRKENGTPERVPFDDALRKILSAPPQHKTAKTKKKTG
jgi:hypothetical protein